MSREDLLMYRGGPRTLGVTGRTGIPKVGTVIFRTDEIVSAAANGALPCGRYWASTGACRIGSRLDISQPHLPDTPPAVAVFSGLQKGRNSKNDNGEKCRQKPHCRSSPGDCHFHLHAYVF